MTTRDLGASLREAANDLGLQQQATRQVVIQTLYATTGSRRRKISLGEICCITGWSGSTLDRNLRKRVGGRKTLYGIAEKPPLGGKKYQRYNLDKVDEWLEDEHKGTWDKIQDDLKPVPPQLVPMLTQITTGEQASKILLPILLDFQNKIEQISSLQEPVATLIRAAQAGKLLGFATLADAMTKYTWTSTKHREQARKVWLRVLDSEQKQIVRNRELDQKQAAATERVVLERALPKGRPSDRGPKRLGGRRL